MGFSVDTVLKEVKKISLSTSKLESSLKTAQNRLSAESIGNELEKQIRKRTETNDIASMLGRLTNPLPVPCDPEKDVLERLQDALGAAAYQNLTKCNQKSILDSIFGQSKIGRVLLKINDEFNLIDKKDIATLDNMLAALNTLKDGPLLLIAAGLLSASHGSTDGPRAPNENSTSTVIEKNDEEAELALMENIIEQSLRIGAVGMLAALEGKFKTVEQKKELYIRAFGYAADHSRLDIITTILDFTGVTVIRARHPNAVKRILQSYKFSDVVGENKTPTNTDYHNELTSLLTRIDPNWDTITVGSRRISNLDVMRNISDDARDLFMVGDDYDVVVSLSLTHEIEHLSTVIRNRHGNIYV